MAIISGELEAKSRKIAGLELQLRNERNGMIELTEELQEALAPSLRAVGMQQTLRHAGTGLQVLTTSDSSTRTRRPRGSAPVDDGPSTSELRRFAESTDWIYSDPTTKEEFKISQWPKRLPGDVKEALMTAYKASQNNPAE
jgi:hypothetical protein